MSVDKQIYDELKKIAREHKIEILIPQAEIMDSEVSEHKLLSSNNFRNIADNMLSISINKSPNHNNPIIIKNRKICEITECIKSNNKVGLNNYLNKLYKEAKELQLKEGVYEYRFINNFVYLINQQTEDREVFFNILENSQLFKDIISNKDNFWIKVGFEAENYDFLRKKVSLDNILQCENLQVLIHNAKTDSILEQLLKEPKFIDYLENNLNIINFMGNNFFKSERSDYFFKCIVSHINLYKTIDLTSVYVQYTKNQEIIKKESIEFKFFNDIIKTLILYSNYEFKKEDVQLEVLNEENQQLISKKVLNTTLHKNLVEKNKDKLRSKI